MEKLLLYPIGTTKACQYAAAFLSSPGISLIDHPSPEVTHLLLDVPSFRPDGELRGGGNLAGILSMLPKDVCVVGGNLSHTVLEKHRAVDFLQDPVYLARNAAITADCAIQTAHPLLETIFAETSVLILGWGRIGKCLAQLLAGLGAEVTIAARKETDRAMIQALGFGAADMDALPRKLSQYRLIYNTVPELLLDRKALALCRNCVKIDLASKPGMEGEDIVWARGLPGTCAPESSGRLIADTFLRLCKEESL